VQSARDEANAVLAAARARIGGEIDSARRALLADVGSVSAAISTKLAGKELR
jgi:F0F1-type ATP synthase membrane subunit b/b'